MHKILNWHPWGDNPLDYMNVELATPDEREVIIERWGLGFAVLVDGVEHLVTDSNAVVCGTLYELEAGIIA